MLTPEARQEIITWWQTSTTIREPKSKAALARKIGCSTATIDNIKKEMQGGQKQERVSFNHDTENYLDQRAQNVDQALLRACEKGNAAALKIFYQLTKKLVEQSEHTHKFELSGDDNARINLEAERRAREFRENRGVENLQKGLTLLSQTTPQNQG